MERSKHHELVNSLSNGLDILEIRNSSEIRDKLISYINILEKWNRVYNLTAVREPEKMVTYHILDSLSVLPYIKGPKIIDVGAGAGLPGIPIAVLLPDDAISLVDSNAKKTRFMQQAASELNLSNVRVLQTRVEDLSQNGLYDTVISRAFAAVNDMLSVAGHLCKQNGNILAMKGAEPKDEIKDLLAGFKVHSVIKLNVPGLEAQRHLIRICSNG